MGLYVYRNESTFLGKANLAEGRVVGMVSRSSSGHHSTTYAAVVRYADERGQIRQFTDSLSTSPPWYRNGQTVHVLYNSQNVAEAQIDRGTAGNYAPGVIILVLGLLLASIGFAILNKRREREKSNPAIGVSSPAL